MPWYADIGMAGAEVTKLLREARARASCQPRSHPRLGDHRLRPCRQPRGRRILREPFEPPERCPSSRRYGAGVVMDGRASVDQTHQASTLTGSLVPSPVTVAN